MHQPVCEIKHGYPVRSFHRSGVYVNFPILHEHVDCTPDVAVDQERACLIGGKRDITTGAWTQSKSAEVTLYRKPRRLNCVIVYDMNRNVSPQRDIHYGPRAALELATVEPDIHPLVSHHDDEVGRACRHIRGTSPTVCCPETEEMKRIRRSEKPADCHDDKCDHQNASQKPLSRGPFPVRTLSYHSVTTNLRINGQGTLHGNLTTPRRQE